MPAWSTSARNLENTKRNIEIIGEDLVTRHGFTQVPNFILTNKDLSVGAKLYYAMLLKYAREKDYCFPASRHSPRTWDHPSAASAPTRRNSRTPGSLKSTSEASARPASTSSICVCNRREGSGDNECPAAPDRQILPVKSGNGCRPERQNLPLTQYKNMHLIIYEEKYADRNALLKKGKRGTET